MPNLKKSHITFTKTHSYVPFIYASFPVLLHLCLSVSSILIHAWLSAWRTVQKETHSHKQNVSASLFLSTASSYGSHTVDAKSARRTQCSSEPTPGAPFLSVLPSSADASLSAGRKVACFLCRKSFGWRFGISSPASCICTAVQYIAAGQVCDKDLGLNSDC